MRTARWGLWALLLWTSCGTPPRVEPNPCDSVLCGAGRCAVLEDGAPACICSPGFVASGLSCVTAPNPDLCASNPCSNLTNSICQVTAGVLDCVCSDTRIEVSGACVLRTACLPNPCTRAHRTTCRVVGGAASCVCDPGFAPEGDGCSANPVWTCAAQHVDGDAAEPDECPTLAKPLGISTNESRTLQGPGDHDWLSIATTPGRLFTVTVSANVAVLAEVYDTTGLTLLASDNYGQSQASVAFVAPATEALVRVRALRAGDTGTYVIHYEETGIDDWANEPASALPLVAGATFSGQVQYAGDLDVVKFEIPARTAVRFWVVDGGPELLVDLERLDAGRTLRAGDSTIVAFPTFSTLTVTSQANNRRDLLAFQLDSQSLGPDDYSDDPAFGALLPTTGAALAGTLGRDGGDVDSFLIPQQSEHIYRARWLQPQGGSSLNAVVTDSDGNRTVTNYNGLVVWEAPASNAPATLSLSRSPYGYGDGSYSVSVDDLGVDDHGDTITDATPLLSSSANGRLETSVDVDVFSFDAVANHIVLVQVGAGSSFSLSSSVLNTSGFGIASNTSGSGSSYGALIQTTGPHYVSMARAYSSSGDVVSYSFSVVDRGLDDHGDTAANATPLTLGTPRTGELQYGADVDAFTFTALANHIYQVVCQSNGTCSPTIRSPTGQVITTYSPGTVTFISAVAGSYVVEARASGGGMGSYTMTVNDLGVEDHGGTTATATPLTIGTAIGGNIASSDDLDFFSFTTQAGHIYSAATTGTGQPRIEVRDSNGVSVNSGYGSASFAATTSTMYVAVSNFSMGPYSLTVTDRGVDDHGDDQTTATPLTLGAPRTGQLQYTRDVDAFTVTTLAGHHHTVTCTTTTGSCSISVRTTSGGTLATAFQSPTARTSFKTATAISVVIAITGTDGASYTVAALDAGADDHGDDRATATSLASDGMPVSGLLETPSDVDTFVITALAGEVVQLSTAGLQLSVRSPTDQTLLSVQSSGALNTGFLASSGGTYVVELRPLFNTMGSTSYSLTATLGADDFRMTAALTVGTPLNGRIDYASDTDTFSVSLTTGRTYSFTLTTGTRAELRGPTGAFLSSVYPGYNNTLTPMAAGTYTLIVSPDYGVSSLPAYTVTVQ